MRDTRFGPPLRAGEVVEYEGRPCEVTRVTPCAAYIRVKREPKTSIMFDKRTGEDKQVTIQSTDVVAISVHAGIPRIRGGVS